jgi:hypothetical protein
MTGMVKEEILTRQLELGYSIEDGCLVFDFLLLSRSEFLSEPSEFAYLNVDGQQQKLELPAGSMAYTICQVPILLRLSNEPGIHAHLLNGIVHRIDDHVLDPINSQHVFQRDSVVHHLVVSTATIE